MLGTTGSTAYHATHLVPRTQAIILYHKLHNHNQSSLGAITSGTYYCLVAFPENDGSVPRRPLPLFSQNQSILLRKKEKLYVS
ncbi:hypothetical protein KSP40_PGU021933 [Platanthera guangdongensis]|uniref:Uncharacterized protein n=1 Tax=Platanthera guangdongensis TaxID=2320717 RepID=A0ABR2LCI3_9ASPA